MRCERLCVFVCGSFIGFRRVGSFGGKGLGGKERMMGAGVKSAFCMIYVLYMLVGWIDNNAGVVVVGHGSYSRRKGVFILESKAGVLKKKILYTKKCSKNPHPPPPLPLPPYLSQPLTAHLYSRPATVHTLRCVTIHFLPVELFSDSFVSLYIYIYRGGER